VVILASAPCLSGCNHRKGMLLSCLRVIYGDS